MKILKKAYPYIFFLLSGILIALIYNFISNKIIYDTTNINTSNITRNIENSGTKFSISSKNENSKIEKLYITNNTVEFILNIDNFDNFNKEKNVITIFVNNIQVYFNFNNKNNNKKYEFDLIPERNFFEIKIDNINVNKKDNELVILISRKSANYDVMDSYEERKINSSNFFHLELIDSKIKTNDDSKRNYQYFDSEKDIKINNGIYLNRLFNNDKIDIIPFIKTKTNTKIDIPIIIKNDIKFNESNIILLVNDEQYKLDDRDYINIKLSNSLAKFMFFHIDTPNQKGIYKIKLVMNCNNKETQIYSISNTINLIVE